MQLLTKGHLVKCYRHECQGFYSVFLFGLDWTAIGSLRLTRQHLLMLYKPYNFPFICRFLK